MVKLESYNKCVVLLAKLTLLVLISMVMWFINILVIDKMREIAEKEKSQATSTLTFPHFILRFCLTSF